MNSEQFKDKVIEILSQDYKIEFLGENFNKIVSQLSETKTERIFSWIQEVIDKKIRPIMVNTDESYKQFKMNQLLVFRYPLNIEGNEYRILLVKIKNFFYLEFHFGDHEYYDDVRKELGLKKSSS